MGVKSKGQHRVQSKAKDNVGTKFAYETVKRTQYGERYELKPEVCNSMANKALQKVAGTKQGILHEIVDVW